MFPQSDPHSQPPVLSCPGCRVPNLHHYKVEVFERKEDALEGLRVVVERGALSTTPGLDGNPSHRRGAVSIYFWCESCREISRMDIVQHKGATELEIRATGEKYKD